jgi:hypothetical protein
MKTCVVIAASETTQDFVAALLKSMYIDAVLLSSLGELRNTLEKAPVCGILLELTAAITASALDKKATKEFLELYPSAKFRLDGQQVLIPGDTLERFVSKCRQFAPRTIRAAIREARYLAVYLSADESFEDAEKAVTADISNRGCFVCSAREWSVGSRVWLKFLGKDRVIAGTVRSLRPWGNNKYLPGIGIQVDESMAGIG